MAVTIVTSPVEYSPIGNGVWWKLNLSSFGVNPLRSKIICQLFKDDNTPLSDILTHKPPGSVTPEDFIIDATKVVKDASIVKTSVPTLGFGAPGVTENELNIFKGIYLKYGEFIQDTSDCTFVNEDLSDSENSDTVYVINAAKNLQDTVNFAGTDPFPLNHYPCPINIFYDTIVWVWIWNSENVKILHTAYYIDGTTQTLSGSANGDWKCAIFGISNASLSNYFSQTGLLKIESRIYYDSDIGDGTEEVDIETYYTFYSECAREMTYQEIYCLEPLGGFTTFIGEKIETDVESDQETVELPLDIQDPDHINTGNVLINKDSRITQTFIRKLPNTEEHQKYAQAIGSSTKCMIRIKDEDGGSHLAGFILSTNGIKTFITDSMIEITISGQISTAILTQT